MSLAPASAPRATCSTRRPSTRTSSSCDAADPAQRRARDAAPGRPRRLRRAHDRHHLAGRGRRRTACSSALAEICDEAYDAIGQGVNVLDPLRPPRRAPSARRSRRCSRSPPCTTTSCARATRLQRGLVLESGEPREVHHFATLIGYGASAINPYLLFDTVDELVGEGRAAPRASTTPTRPSATSSRRSARACSRRSPRWGSRRSSPTAARRSSRPSAWRGRSIDRHFTGTASRIGGIGLDVLAQEALDRHARAYPADRTSELLPVGGVYAWRRDGEHHMWNPETIALLQHAVRSRNGDAQDKYDEYSQLVNEDADAQGHAARPAEVPRATREPIAARRGRAGQGDRQALRHRRDVARLDLARGARDAGDRDEPPRRPVEHRRGRRGPARASRPTPTATCAARRSSRSPPAASA